MAIPTLVSIVGARPQFIKAATVSRAIIAHNRACPERGLRERFIHTGQHYDHGMSSVFFEELAMQQPDINFGIGSGLHGAQTGRMLEAIERALRDMPHDAVLVYGDTNSTLAGALAAVKMHTPVFHVEAGLRSFNKTMPEEINRVLTDHVSTLLFCPTMVSADNLRKESIIAGVHLVGDVMYDSTLLALKRLGNRRELLDKHGLETGGYLLATVHRAENTDAGDRLRAIFDALQDMARTTPVVLPLHPRTQRCCQEHVLRLPERVLTVPPLSYMEMLQLAHHAKAIVTDSGGVQKEAFFLEKPCLTMRDETEWTETVACGVNTLCGADKVRMLLWHERLCKGEIVFNARSTPYGNGVAAEKIVDILASFLEG